MDIIYELEIAVSSTNSLSRLNAID